MRKFFAKKNYTYFLALIYSLQIIGLFGLILIGGDFLTKESLQINLESNLPALLSAISEILWPLTAMFAIFWFLPQILDFLKDPRKSIPLLAAFSGSYNSITQENLNIPEEFSPDTIKNLPDIHIAQKELAATINSQLENFSFDEQRSRLVLYAADYQLTAIFERVYNLIFGSQIQALLALEKNKEINIRSFHEAHLQRTEDAKDIQLKKFKIWIALLIDAELVSGKEYIFKLTNRGELFLDFLKNRNYYLDKSF